MIVTRTPAPYSFVRNPIVFEFTTTSSIMIIFTITFAGQSFLISVYPSYQPLTLNYKLSFDISDLLANIVRLTYDATLVSQVNLAGYVQSYTVYTSGYSFTGKVIPGGLSKEYQKFLIHQGTNAFDYRFMNPMSNWLLTTRTDANVISMTRQELACMFFLTPCNQEIAVATNRADRLVITAGTEGVPCMINLPVWLASLAPETPSSPITDILFQVAGINVIQISLTDKLSEESYLIKFRNSLGVYEFIEVAGKATRAPESGDNSTYNVFDTDLQEFRKARQRTNVLNVLNVDTGFKSSDDLYFLGDMLAASSAWFIDRLKKQKCLVTSSNYAHALRQTVPETVTLKIEPVSTEQFYSPMSDINTIYTILATEDDEYIITEDNFMIGV